jgi:hypothetical protein
MIEEDRLISNLEEKSIKDIWNSRQLLLIRKLDRVKKFETIPLCFKYDW